MEEDVEQTEGAGWGDAHSYYEGWKFLGLIEILIRTNLCRKFSKCTWVGKYEIYVTISLLTSCFI